MTVSGLVVTLAKEPERRVRALEALQRDPRIHCGDAHGLRLPVVTETTTLGEGESLFEALRDLDGVEYVDVVSVSFEEGV